MNFRYRHQEKKWLTASKNWPDKKEQMSDVYYSLSKNLDRYVPSLKIAKTT